MKIFIEAHAKIDSRWAYDAKYAIHTRVSYANTSHASRISQRSVCSKFGKKKKKKHAKELINKM
jgi:hypothetical protein